ncbi:MAG TPA: hypothetical protein VKG91_14170 [Roseiarcus sp.]|nr:hypothetical protein [Roseiarcus sp.]
MPDNERTGVEKCLTDPQFRDMLKNHSAASDRGYISDELDRIGIVFLNDNDGSKKNAVIDYIVKIKWSELEGLETALKKADGHLQPFMG